MRILRRVLLAAVLLLAGVVAGSSPAGAATFDWSHACGWGDYWDVASRSAGADVDGAVAGLCKVKAHALCQHPNGSLLGTYGSTWKGLGEGNSYVTCPSPYTTRVGIGSAILA